MTSQVSLQNLPKIHKFLLTVCSPGLMRITEVSCGSFEGSSSQTSCPCLHSASSYKCEPSNILGWFFLVTPKLASLDNILAHLRRAPRDTSLRNAFSLLSYPWLLRSRLESTRLLQPRPYPSLPAGCLTSGLPWDNRNNTLLPLRPPVNNLPNRWPKEPVFSSPSSCHLEIIQSKKGHLFNRDLGGLFLLYL